MGDKTAISWANHTFNIWWGCSHSPRAPGSTETSPECDSCYAETFDKRLGGAHWGPTAPRRFFGDAYWAKPLRWNTDAERAGVRARVFCASQADWAEIHADPEINAHMHAARARLWNLIQLTPWLDWLLLTKRAENLATMLPWEAVARHERTIDVPYDPPTPWPNVWAGVTCGARSSLWRIPLLRAARAAVRFVSCEPLLDHITADDWDAAIGSGEVCDSCGEIVRYWNASGEGFASCGCCQEGPEACARVTDAVDLLIVGDESGHGRRPADPDWVRTARDAASRHGVAFHFKQWAGADVPGITGARKGANGKIHLPLLDGHQHAAFPEVP
jgi:protein gp37